MRDVVSAKWKNALLWLVGLCVLLSGWLGVGIGSPLTPGQVLVQRLASVHAFSANFTQTVVLQRGGAPQQSSGSVAIWEGHVRWTVDQPQPQWYITDGKTLWQIDEFLEQVVIRPLSHQMASAPILLLMGDPQVLLQRFSVTEPASGHFELMPLQHLRSGEENTGVGFLRADIFFHDNFLSRLTFEEGLGERTSLQFSKMDLHPALSAKDFQVSIPAGYDVLDERSTAAL